MRWALGGHGGGNSAVRECIFPSLKIFRDGALPQTPVTFLNVKKSAPTNLTGRFALPSSVDFRNSPFGLRQPKIFHPAGGSTHLEVSKGIENS